MASKHDLMALMVSHCGKHSGIGVKAISDKLNVPERRVRQLVTECRECGIAICGHPATGYFVAQNSEELQETMDFLKDRALHSLKLASTLGNIPMADLIGQLHLKT